MKAIVAILALAGMAQAQIVTTVEITDAVEGESPTIDVDLSGVQGEWSGHGTCRVYIENPHEPGDFDFLFSEDIPLDETGGTATLGGALPEYSGGTRVKIEVRVGLWPKGEDVADIEYAPA